MGGTLESPNLKPSEIFIALAAILTFIHLVQIKFRVGPDFQKFLIKIFLLLGVFYLSLFAGTFISSLNFNNLPIKLIGMEYFRISIAILFFLLVIFYGVRDKNFVRLTFFAFLSPLIVAFIGRIPQAVEALGMTGGGTRFKGFFSDPNYFANFSIIAVIFLFVAALKTNWRLYQKILCGTGATLIMSTIWWSGSRSGWAGIIVGFLVASVTIIRFSSSRVKISAAALITFIAILSTGFFLLDDRQKTDTFARTGYYFDFKKGVGPGGENATDQSFIRALPLIIYAQPKRLQHGQDRKNLWFQSLGYSTENPLGFGPGYHRLVNLKTGNEGHRAVHGVIFEIILTAGVIGLILFGIGGYFLIKDWLMIKKPDYVWIGTYAALIGVLASSLFLDSLNLRWLWTLGAMLTALNKK